VLASLGPHALWSIAWRHGTEGMLTAEFAALRLCVADGEPLVDHRHGPGDEVWLIFERRSNGETNTPCPTTRPTLRSRPSWRPSGRGERANRRTSK
jgi:hypothetical protein